VLRLKLRACLQTRRRRELEHGHLLAESERLIAHFQRLLVDALA
jgi:hypothetical protein